MMELQPVVNPVNGNNNITQDLDLIDVLWRQDIDLGLGKDAFDYNLRQELEKEREIELQKERQKQKDREIQQKKVEEQQRQQYQQWLADNFMQDGETGEWIPLGGRGQNGQQQQQQPLMPNSYNNFMSYNNGMTVLNEQQHLQSLEGDYRMSPHTEPGAVFSYGNAPLMSPHHHQQQPQPQQQSTQQQPQTVHDLVQSYMPNGPSYNNNNTQQQLNNNTQQQNAGCSYREQDSLEDRWQDLVNLLELPSNDSAGNTSHMNTSNAMSQDQSSNITSPMAPLPNTSSVLIQNATLPLPPQVNNSTLSPSFGNETIQPQIVGGFRSNNECPTPLDWEQNEMFFGDGTNGENQTNALTEVERILPDIIADQDLDDFNITEMALNDGLRSMQMLDDNSSESGISIGSSGSPVQDQFSEDAKSPFDGLEGATGGQDFSDGSPGFNKASNYESSKYNYGSGGDGYSSSNSEGYSNSEDSARSNFSSSSNESDFNFKLTKSSHIRHNHSYPLQPGQEPREYKKYSINTDKPRPKGPQCKDAKRLSELKVPLSLDDIVDTPVEEFNEMLTQHKLTEPQLQLIRDIRRRGKNKVAAQNCRKRKMDVIYSLEDEMGSLKESRDRLLQERHMIDKQAREMKDKFSALYREIFQSLRDEHGQPYDPQHFSLQQSSDGNVFLVPRNITTEESIVKTEKKKKTQKK